MFYFADVRPFRSHQHEMDNGKTSCVSEHSLDVDWDGKLCIQTETFDRPRDDKLARKITFCDLAGHSKYLRTTGEYHTKH